MSKNKTTVPAASPAPVPGASAPGNTPVINRRARKAIERHAKRKNKGRKMVKSEDVKVVYNDDSYIDKTKKAFTSGMKAVKERLAKKNAKHELPERIITERRPLRTTCLIINREGRERAFLPDVPPKFKILVHGCIARTLVSKVCMILRITKNHSEETDEYIDGSYAITPAMYRMMSTTTIQKCRRRPWFFLRRYWYEISFDGRVQPAHLLYDYDLDPEAKKTRLWITREYVPIAKTDRFNDYFRFWRNKPPKVTPSANASL